MMRFVYHPLVKRFNIPRPTLIEWQKCIKAEKLQNWRSAHLEYLREQIEAESETKQELQDKAIFVEELFYISVYLFLNCKRLAPKRVEFKQGFRDFMLNPKKTMEYQHDFAKRIWKEETVDNIVVVSGDYIKVFNLIDSLTSFQYYVLIRSALKFIFTLYDNENLTCQVGLTGKTWQELHSYDKNFSNENVEKFFKSEKII